MCEYLRMTDGLTVYCKIVCGRGVLFLCGVVSVGWIGETLCCVVVGSLATVLSFKVCWSMEILLC